MVRVLERENVCWTTLKTCIDINSIESTDEVEHNDS